MSGYEDIYEEFWKSIVEAPDGTINLDAVKRELHDYHTAICEVSQAYWHLTNGRFSKLNTMHGYIIEAVEKSYRRDEEEVEKEARTATVAEVLAEAEAYCETTCLVVHDLSSGKRIEGKQGIAMAATALWVHLQERFAPAKKEGVRFRHHRGFLEDSLETTVIVCSLAELEQEIRRPMRFWPPDRPIEIRFEHCGYDERCGWDTYNVTILDEGHWRCVGMSDGVVPGGDLGPPVWPEASK